MEYKTIQLAFDSGVATVTLNRPEKRNAISHALVEELLAALDEIEKSSAQVAILTGAGKAFCAGLDLDELKALLGKTHDENVQDSTRTARIFRRIYDFPLPTIAAVNGAAIAGGTGFATMCDFTLAVPEAKFGYTEVRIGFVPAIVSSVLVWQVGHKIARDLLLTGRLIRRNRSPRFWPGQRSGRTVSSDGAGARVGGTTDGEQPIVGASDQAPDQRIHRRTTRPADCQSHRRQCAHTYDCRLSRRYYVVPGKTQAALEH